MSATLHLLIDMLAQPPDFGAGAVAAGGVVATGVIQMRATKTGMSGPSGGASRPSAPRDRRTRRVRDARAAAGRRPSPDGRSHRRFRSRQGSRRECR